MKTLNGDLIEFSLSGTFDVIIHGCNCLCSMDAGIAKAIKEHFPEAFEADCATVSGDKSKSGSISFATVERNGYTFVVVNAYTQYHWKGSGVLADYDAIQSAMCLVKNQFSGKRIGYPKIGAGLAKGDWKIISEIINEELEGEDHTLVKYVK